MNDQLPPLAAANGRRGHWRTARRILASLAGLALMLLCDRVGGEPMPKTGNPVAGNEKAIREGGVLFRQNCVGCHGAKGRGGLGPDLTDTRWRHGSRDQDLFRVIRHGVRGTSMREASAFITDENVWKIVAFVRTLARTASDPEWQPYLKGDPVAGKKLFWDNKSKASCVKCHAVDGVGGNLGPVLSYIAAQRSPKHIMESLVLPSANIDPNFEGVVVMTKSGRVLTGIRVNEDNFSIQLREQETGRLISFLKHELTEILDQKKSLMPEVVEQLTVKELHDLFAYLLTLDGRQATPPKAK